MFDPALDEALRSPLDRIIAAADRIVDRSEGPLRSDYAAYAGDIAAAGRHLLSVIRSMTEQEADRRRPGRPRRDRPPRRCSWSSPAPTSNPSRSSWSARTSR